MPPPMTTTSSIASVPKLASPSVDVRAQLLFERAIDRRVLVLVERLSPDLGTARGCVAAAVSQPPLVVLGRGEERSIEARAEALQGVGRAQEVATRSDLCVRAEREGVLVDLERVKRGFQHAENLDVDDELLVGGHKPRLEPAGCMHDV